MPELPEVETIVWGLKNSIINKVIASVSLNSSKINKDNRRGWLNILRGKRFLDVRRRGKNILIDLSENYTLWVHLKMTGHLYLLPESVPVDKHDLMIFVTKNNSHQLRFNDYRRFGRIRLFRIDEVMKQSGLVDLGPEPLEISREDFINLFKTRQRMIKPALLDQTFLAGLGNIYSDESLYLAKIHPKRLTGRISKARLAELHAGIQSVLKRAIRLMGTSVDSYAGVDG